VLPPPPLSSSPNIAIIIRRLMKNPDKRGGKGMLPVGCLPLPQRISELQEKEDFNKAHLLQKTGYR
jgi:hypothetical protein